MDFLKRLTVLFIVTVVLFFGCTVLLFVTHWLSFESAYEFARVIYSDQNLRLIAGGTAAVVLLLNFILYRIFSINVRRARVIAFDNPSGRVSVSLQAIEELIKRILTRMPEVKDSKIAIRAARRGLHVIVKLSLMSDVNIPGLTSRVQDAILNKVQDTIGLEERVDVQVYIGKISPQDHREAAPGADEGGSQQAMRPGVPYHGYRT